MALRRALSASAGRRRSTALRASSTTASKPGTSSSRSGSRSARNACQIASIRASAAAWPSLLDDPLAQRAELVVELVEQCSARPVAGTNTVVLDALCDVVALGSNVVSAHAAAADEEHEDERAARPEALTR